MATLIRLFDLANLSIGTPEVGAVNFNALHTLLHAIIKHFNIQDIKTEIPEEERGLYESLGLWGESQQGKVAIRYHQMERKIQEIERLLQALNNLPTGSDLMEKTKGMGQQVVISPVGDMWQMMQMKKKIESNEAGVSKAMALLQDVLHEITNLQDSKTYVENQLQNLGQKVTECGPADTLQDLKQRLNQIEQQRIGVESLDWLQRELELIHQKLNQLEERLAQYPSPDDLSNKVGWDILRETLVRPKYTTDSQTSDTTVTEEKVHQQDPQGFKLASKHSLTTKITAQGPQQGSQLSIEHSPMAQPSQQGVQQGSQLARKTLTEPVYVTDISESGTQKVSSNNGLSSATTNLVTTQQRGPVSSSIGLTSATISLADTQHTSADNRIQEGSTQSETSGKTFIQTLSVDQPHISGTQRVQKGRTHFIASPISAATYSKTFPSTTALTSSSDSSSASKHHDTDTVEALRNIGTLSAEYSQILERIQALESDKADRAELRLLLAEIDLHGFTLPDMHKKLNSLLEDMQVFKVDREKDGELLGHIQNTMLQLQEECEKLNVTTSNLIQDHQQDQRHIDILYQSVEKLDEKKADKDHIGLEIDVKADKRALEGKVSRTQFDATTEQLNNMIQELLSRVSGQEQDWQRILEKISLEMQSKLDRMELDPFKNKLEERWKAIRRQLQERSPQYEADEAAGIRKQLISQFHCISCDRPVDMMVPGPQILNIPSMPSFPAHRSNRPYTVYELEQIRQHNRNHRFLDMNDFYLSSARSCGGSHTLTFPHRRYVKLQNIIPSTSMEDEATTTAPKLAEVDILGYDGQIYRGRMDQRFPSIPPKDGKRCMLKTRMKFTQGSQKCVPYDGYTPPSRPQSAKSSGRSSIALSRTTPEHLSSACQHSQVDNQSHSRETLEFRVEMNFNQPRVDESVM
ncbi:glutamine-rich protein 2 [Pelodytes ibericus]